ncbi:SAM-dependent methyltransferase (plasmid) [Legionella sp. D16C41]|uniref:SAM-dependent methyltransferase n=1 Tax=Legionella sp. D16C41 TaxID=3402688 RepID=UPI003AF443EC
MNKKLVLIGSGIKTISHLTIEAQAYIKQADCVLYLVNEPIFEKWLNKYSKKCISLENHYFLYEKRAESYKKIADEILNYTEQYDFVSIVLYGHPTIFSSPGLDAIKRAKERNIETVVLPGISAEDCLFADLKVDPSQNGCLSVEAMSFLIFDDKVDKHYDLVIWQLGMVGNIEPVVKKNSKKGLSLIQEKLLKIYSSQHEVILYEAALYPGIKPKITKFAIELLINQNISSISTLYIPAEKKRLHDEKILFKLNLKIEDFQ